MPVLYASGHDQGVLAPLSATAQPHQEAPNSARIQLSAKLQSLDEAASVAPMNGLLTDLAQHAQGPAALDSTLASAQASTQQSQFSNAQLSHAAEPDLFRSAVKELEIASDIKNVLQGARAEIRQIAGGLVSDQAEQAAELAQLRRRIEEGQTNPYGGYRDRPRTEAERRLDEIRVSVMLSQLIDELTPWAIGVGVCFVLFHATRWMMRSQSTRQLKTQALRAQARDSMRGEARTRRRSSSSSRSSSRSSASSSSSSQGHTQT
ncbi:hypothetical protein WG899_13405 [Paucibacter sp. AS339]|uniref:hypothetical protein n=1 Tax=Paucibacter hankyongi TaxID=3133434 RepID=UPI0030B57B0D